MVDARFPERWLNDRRFLRLSAEAYRAFAMVLMWTVSNRTDGALDRADVPLIPRVDDETVRELLRAGLLEEQDGVLKVTEFRDTQTSREQLEAAAKNRRRDAVRKREHRSSKAADSDAALPAPREHRSPAAIPPDVHVDVPPETRGDVQGDVRMDVIVEDPPDNWPDFPPDNWEDSAGQDRTGKDRQGQAKRTNFLDEPDWPAVKGGPFR
ncbi:MAG: hypothetical protein JWO98_169 [Frankiales bacterium]|nr:hypothetical protein [Frankiales bacterium]